MQFDHVLKVAVRGGASDIILKVGARPRFRFNGGLVSLSDGDRITEPEMDGWIKQILPPHLAEAYEKRGDVDFAYESTPGDRFRVNLFRQRASAAMVLRVIKNHIKTIDELQLPGIVHDLCDLKRGLVLVTGATGSGKSTTLASVLQKINETRPSHIITIEDPIEFNFKDARSTVNQREIGLDVGTFAEALRSAMRQNPDVIFIGELRDAETICTALKAAETGHLVFSTLHTSDASETLSRILAYFEPHEHPLIRMLLAANIKAVLSQRLVRRQDDRGLMAAVEVLIGNARVAQVIQEAKNFSVLKDVITQGETYGMQSFDQALARLYEDGEISQEEAIQHASNRDNFRLLLRGVGSSTSGF